MTEHHDLVNDIKLVLDITSRVDERVKMIAEGQQQMNIRLNHFIDEHNALAARVTVLESKNISKMAESVQGVEEKITKMVIRVETLETLGSPLYQRIIEENRITIIDLKNRINNLEEHKQNVLDKIRRVLGFVGQAIFTILVCYILYKLGINSPPIP